MLLSIAAIAWVILVPTTEVADAVRPGERVPEFTVMSMDGHKVHSSNFHGQVIVVTFISTRCPISNAFNKRMNDLYLAYRDRVRFLFVNSSPRESIAEVAEHAKAVGYDFPVFSDPDSTVAERLGATATPDAFVIDSAGVLRYHGYIEDALNSDRVKHRGLRLAVEATLNGSAVPVSRTRAFGCSRWPRRLQIP